MMDKLDSLMFDDIGKKIKEIVRWYMYVMLGLLLVGGVVMELVALWQMLDGNELALLAVVLIPVAVALAACLVWLSVVLIYGFGEVVDTAIANRKERTGAPAMPPQPPVAPVSFVEDVEYDEDPSDDVWTCLHCEGEVTYVPQSGVWFCSHCQRMYQVVGNGWTQRLKEL